jgi:putative ABC transport system permease protein
VPHSPSPTWFDHLREIGRELARGLRTAAKRPAFSLVAIATLGIGIGASTATFSIADAVLIRPLPVHEQRTLAVLWGWLDQAGGIRAGQVPVPYGAFKGFVDGSPRTLSAVAGVDYHGAVTLPVREGADGVNLKVASVTGNLFSVLGVTPLRGRNLRAEDDRIGAAPVVAISFELWQRRYGADPSVLGRVLTILGQPGTIVAVMPRGFGFPAQTEVWMTARPFRPVTETANPPDFLVYLVGRLAPGATFEQSATELTNYLRSNDALLPMLLRGMTASAEALDDDLLGDVRPVIGLLLVASALVMLVAIVNVGALFLALGLTKQQELAVRVSLGATTRRLLLVTFGDALVVAAAGAVLGVAIAYGVVRMVVSFASTQLPRADGIDVNGVTLAFAVALAIVATVAFAIACVYGPRRPELSRVLNAATRGGTGTQAARRTQRALVVAQVALAVTVILGAGLVARSQVNLETVDLGLAGDRILVVQVVPPQHDDYANPQRFNAGLDRVIEAIAPLPGVQGVAPMLSEPFGGMAGWDAGYLLDGQAPEEEGRQPKLSLEVASPTFFQTLGIEIVRGRAFTDEDRGEGRPVVILSESAARLAWPNQDAVGERIKIAGTWTTVVGVAADTRYRELTVLRPTAYRPRDQFEAQFAAAAALPFLAVRTAGDPIGLAPAIRSAGQAMWPGATFASLRRLDGYSSESLARSRVTAALFVAFAAICLLLSTIGLYGVVTAQVVERTREVGIRMALGAPRGVVLRAVLLEGATMALIGMIGGAAIATLFSGWLETILYGVSRHDPATIAGVALLVCLVTGVATYIPARRAASIEPTAALREV